MRRTKKILLLLTLLISFTIQRAFAAFIIDDGGNKKESKFSLKQLHKEESPFSLSSITKKKYSFENFTRDYSLPPITNVPKNSVEIQSPVVLQNGHTMYIYNYKYKVETTNPLPMFKTPTRADYR